MLHTLLHSGIGDVAAVVTRYYGGTKLGKGGLGRAYSGGVQEALASLPTVVRVFRIGVVIEVAYAHLDPLKRLLEQLEAEVEKEGYGETVILEIQLPEAHLDALAQQVADLSAGRARLRNPEKEGDRG
jgi:putative IMPACT (imprinted ancient) family translation regulator